MSLSLAVVIYDTVKKLEINRVLQTPYFRSFKLLDGACRACRRQKLSDEKSVFLKLPYSGHLLKLKARLCREKWYVKSFPCGLLFSVFLLYLFMYANQGRTPVSPENLCASNNRLTCAKNAKQAEFGILCV